MAKMLNLTPSAHHRKKMTRYATAKLTINVKDMVSVCITAERDADHNGSSRAVTMVNPAGRRKPTPRTQMVKLLHG